MIYIIKYLFLLFLMKEAVSIVVKNGGYEDVYIYVQDTNEENSFLLQRIQEVFTDASKLMFTATRQRLYFRRIRIVIPKSWPFKPEYKKMPVPSPFKQYIVVDKDGIKTPHVRGLDKCGGEGIYMYLNAVDFLLKKGITNWGLHDHVIVHEWGHLRWGIFDEYPVKFPAFYQADGKWRPVSCTGQIEGRVGSGSQCKTTGEQCNLDNTGRRISRNCKFCPIPTQSLNISLMSYTYLDKVLPRDHFFPQFNATCLVFVALPFKCSNSATIAVKQFTKKGVFIGKSKVSMFCDKDDVSVDEDQRHNSRAPNMQNLFCGQRSAWEVMRTHNDFKVDVTLPVTTNTTPEFEIVQGSETFRVFVLDVSGSMANQKLVTLRQTGEYVIQEVIMQGSWLGIVTFSSSASTVKQLTQINSQSDRDALKAALPISASGATCIGCGIEEAIKILKSKLGNAENAEMVVISDGLNNRGNIQTSTQKAVREKVIVHTIAVTQQADKLLVNIAEETGGKHYTYLETGSIGFASSFSETITGDLTSVKSQHVMLLSEKIDSTTSKTLQFNFTIEGGIGSNTSITVIMKTDQTINIEITGPNNFTQNLNTRGTYATLLIQGVAMVGQYEVNISLQQSQQAIEYYVKSIPTSEDIVKITSWLSTSNVNLLSDDLPVVYVDVRKHFTPLINANVTARAESGTSSCEIVLEDSGKDPDAVQNDGIYSGYLFLQCLRSGRVNVKGYVRGHAGKTSRIKKIFGAPAIEEVDEEPEIFNESFQRVQVLEELYVSNYRDPGTKDIISPGRITDVNIYNIVSETTQYGESRSFTIAWTATGDDKNIGNASAYIFRISDNMETLLHDFDSADLLETENATLSPQEAGMTEALKIVVDAEQSYTKTTFFAIKAVDEAGNIGKVSNIVPIVVANGYRASGGIGSLEIETEDFPKTLDEDGIDKSAIIGGTVGGVCSVLLCLLVFFLCRRRLITTNAGDDVQLGKV